MTVFFHGAIREKYTEGEKSYEASGAGSVRALIEILGERFGERFHDFLLGGSNCFFLVNGTGIMTTGGLDTKLGAEDEVEVLPFVDGG